MDPSDNDKILEMLNETGELSRLYNMAVAQFIEHLRQTEKRSVADAFVIEEVISSIFGGTRTLPSKEVEKDKAMKRILFKDKYGLTDDQMKTLSLLAGGLKYSQIADELIISVEGINKRVQRIYRKMRVNSRHNATKIAKSEWLA